MLVMINIAGYYSITL